MDNINVLYADNQPYTRLGITNILNGFFNNQMTVDQAKNKEELFKKLHLNNSHVLIIDYDLFDLNNINDLSDIKKISPGIGILVITDNRNPENVIKVLDCGITNYILKSSGEQELIDAFNATVSNRKYLSSAVLDVLLNKKNFIRNRHTSHRQITPSEINIVKLISQGLTTKEIALQKKLSYHTIISHRKNIFRKIGINNISELIMYAMRTGIVDSTEYYI